MSKFAGRSLSILLAVLMIVSVFVVCPVTAGAIADTSDPWIFAVNDGRIYDLDGKWVRFEDEDFQLSGSGAFSISATSRICTLSYGGTDVAKRNIWSGLREAGNTMYVTGLGTEELPYIFTPNIVFGKSGGTFAAVTAYIGYENLPTRTNDGIDSNDESFDYVAVPGDGFTDASRLMVGKSNFMRFVQQSNGIYQPITSGNFAGYFGVRLYSGSVCYGMFNGNAQFTSNTTHFPIQSGNNLYFLGREDYSGNSLYTFSESVDNKRISFSGTNNVLCTVTWEDQDGFKFRSATYSPGEIPTTPDDLVVGGTNAPNKDEDAAHTYTFTGFEPAYEPLTDDMTYVATYDATPKGEMSYTVNSWIFSTGDGRVYDEADDLEHKCYRYNGSIGAFPAGGGAFSVENGQLLLCGLVVADIDNSHPDYKTFADTVYVTGTGTQDDPFIFNPNYIYGDASKANVKDGVSISIDSTHTGSGDKGIANPGDGFRAMSKIRVGSDNVQFMQQLGYYHASRAFLGVGETTYGYRYSKTRALPFSFVGDDDTLYYYEKSAGGVYQFSETEPPYRTNFSSTESTIHTVTWKNYDGTVLYKETYYINDTPSYKGDTPVKPSDDYNYIFSGWTPAISPVTADTEYTATYTQSERLFVGHSLTLKGDIGLNFYLNVTPEQITTGDGVNVHFEWDVKGNTKTSDYKLKTGEYTVIGGKTYYKATCWVAVAEMNYNIHATATVNGALHPDTDDYCVKEYGMYVIGAPAGEFEKQELLVTLVKEMLNYGAQAQKVFDRMDVPLANAEVTGYTMTEIGYETIPEQKSNMKDGLSELGLEYQGTTVVFLTKTTLRHYYSITDQAKFNAVKNTATFTYKDDKLSTGGVIYFEKSDISASDLDAVQSFGIGGKTYNYSVLDYSRGVLKSGSMTDNEKMLAMSTYWYNHAANAYFDAP